MPAPELAPYDQALRLAALVHAGQMWKGTPVPYLTHLVQVSRYLEQDGQPAALVLAGLLHDTLEDVEDTPELRQQLRAVYPELDVSAPGRDALAAALAALIARRFGDDVRRLVEAVTTRAAEDETPAQRRARREQQIAHLSEAADDVVLLKSADTRANVTALAEALSSPVLAEQVRASAPVDELCWYYGEVAGVVIARLKDDHPMAAALASAHERLRRVLHGGEPPMINAER